MKLPECASQINPSPLKLLVGEGVVRNFKAATLVIF